MSAAAAAASAAALSNRRSVTRSSSSVENSHRYNHQLYHAHSAPELYKQPAIGHRYESQKRRDWNHFVQYLKKRHRPPFKLSFCTGADVVEFLRYLNQTKVHASSCPYSDHSQPPPPCSCPLPGSADALIRRLRVAFEENGGPPATNPFCSSAVGLYLEELWGSQAKAEAMEE